MPRYPVLLLRDIEDGPDKSTSSPASRRYLLDFCAWAGRAEREKFEERRYAWRPELVTLYDNAKTYIDGKWLTLPISDGSDLRDVKDLLLMKRPPVSSV
ncbi:UNVERIFIED_ORG: hypothetical protein GGD51_000597 [Rhizobium esperanzae]